VLWWRFDTAMPFEVALPASMKRAGWKVKILEKERLEPPHITIRRGVRAWRLGLRDGEFLMPPGGSWNDVPAEVRTAIQASWTEAVQAWNRMYPKNPVESTEHD
jgi:hypothetical protein